MFETIWSGILWAFGRVAKKIDNATEVPSQTPAQKADFEAVEARWKVWAEQTEKYHQGRVALIEQQWSGYTERLKQALMDQAHERTEERAEFVKEARTKYSRLEREIEECHKEREADRQAREADRQVRNKQQQTIDTLEREQSSMRAMVEELKHLQHMRSTKEFRENTEEVERKLLESSEETEVEQ